MASIEDLASELSRQLALYANAVEEDIDKAAKNVSKQGKTSYTIHLQKAQGVIM